MNKPIRRVAVVVLVLFGLLLANGTYLILGQEKSLNANQMNRRTRDAEFGRHRGSILVGDTAVAYSKKSDDKYGYQRVYPHPKLYAPVTGFFSYDHGSSELEARYNSQLAGSSDSLFTRRLVDEITGKPREGASIQTTINADAQRAAEKGLGGHKGAAVALDPKTGEILALVSTPSYDPNKIADHNLSKASKAYKSYLADSNDPLSNRATREIYPPGSTFKMVTAAAAMKNGVQPDDKVASPNRFVLPDTTTYLHNENNESCGGNEITFTHALEVSCNTAFAKLGLKVGAKDLRRQAEKFGFNSRPLPGSLSAASRFPDELNQSQLALSSIGQYDVAASPLQMAMVTAGIGNDGTVMKPHLVRSVRAPDLKVISKTKPSKLHQAMSTAHAHQLTHMMVDVVKHGTGQSAQISGMKVAGKTGTAQSDPKRKPYAWFTALAPAKHPQIAVAVMVADAPIPRSEIAGGRLAAPIARSMIKAVVHQ
jgi:peptidoglycan glycosyltransferase